MFTQPQGNFSSVYSFRSHNYSQGYNWFDSSNMRMFGTRLHDTMYGGCVFVTSDKTHDGKRKYSVRVAMADGSVHSYAFVQYDTRHEAHKEAKWLASALKDGRMAWDNQWCEFKSTEATIIPSAS